MIQARRTRWNWIFSLLLIAALHISLGVWALGWHVQTPPVPLPPAAVQIALAPLPSAAPPAPAQQTAPPPPPPPQIEPEPKAPKPLPKLAEAVKPKLALPPPKPKPKPKPPKPKAPPKPVEKPLKKPDEKPQENPTRTRQNPAAESTAHAAAPAAPQLSSVSGPSKAEVSWQSRLLSHLGRYKRYPNAARRRGAEGTSLVRFSLDGAGKVLSVSLAKSSGNAALDRATLAMIRRAQPLPAPPAELLKGGSLEVIAPFVYALERR
ncbi:MAG: energy transducer TonB family protein [Pseudomonas sp.]